MAKLALVSALALAALSAVPALAFTNPARGTCERFRGDFFLVSAPNGAQLGLCALPNGYVIEEATLLRMQYDSTPIYGGGFHHRRW